MADGWGVTFAHSLPVSHPTVPIFPQTQDAVPIPLRVTQGYQTSSARTGPDHDHRPRSFANHRHNLTRKSFLIADKS